MFGFNNFFDEVDRERPAVFKTKCALTFFVWLNLFLQNWVVQMRWWVDGYMGVVACKVNPVLSV